MINELNLTPTQYIILIIILIAVGRILSRSDSFIEIEISQEEETPQQELSPLYGAYIQLQGHYYNWPLK